MDKAHSMVLRGVLALNLPDDGILNISRPEQSDGGGNLTRSFVSDREHPVILQIKPKIRKTIIFDTRPALFF